VDGEAKGIWESGQIGLSFIITGSVGRASRRGLAYKRLGSDFGWEWKKTAGSCFSRLAKRDIKI